MKIQLKKLVLVAIILVAMILLGTTKVNAITEKRLYVEGITNDLDIATETITEAWGEKLEKPEPVISGEEFKKLQINELVRGKNYVIWDGGSWILNDNCTLSVNGIKFGTLEKTTTRLWGDFPGEGYVLAYILKVDKDAVLPTETDKETGNKYYPIETSAENWTLLLPSDVTLVDKETLQTNTITSNDTKIGITGKISSGAKLVSNEIVETVPEFQMMQTVLTHYLKNEFTQYNNEVLFIKEIKIENGNFEGKLTLNFDIGTKYNDKKFVVAHQKSSNSDIEYFNGTIKDGKATIEVTELSPFAISVLTEKAQGENNQAPTTTPDKTPTKNKGEKDTTPKTGTIDIIGYVLVTTILSGIGIVALKKKI